MTMVVCILVRLVFMSWLSSPRRYGLQVVELSPPRKEDQVGSPCLQI